MCVLRQQNRERERVSETLSIVVVGSHQSISIFATCANLHCSTFPMKNQLFLVEIKRERVFNCFNMDFVQIEKASPLLLLLLPQRRAHHRRHHYHQFLFNLHDVLFFGVVVVVIVVLCAPGVVQVNSLL